MTTQLVAYYRVSTVRQGAHGLGMDAQLAAVAKYAASADSKIIKEYVEVESGKRTDRPELALAMRYCRQHGATLAIAKIDRLSRNTLFLLTIIESDVPVVFCDMPQLEGPMGKFMLTQMAAVAELEAGLVSQRTKAALQAYRDNGRISRRIKEMYPEGVPPEIVAQRAGKLGAQLPECHRFTPEQSAEGVRISAERARKKQDEFNAHLRPILRKLVRQQLSYQQMADILNASENYNAAGRPWTRTYLCRVIQRIGLKDPKES